MFNEAAHSVLKRIKIPENVDYLYEIKCVAREIKQALIDTDSIFKNSFQNLESTATYKKGMAFDAPDDMSRCLWLKLPFRLTAEFEKNGTWFVRLRADVQHPLVRDNYLSAERFNFFFSMSLRKSLEQTGQILCENGKVYDLTYIHWMMGNTSRCAIKATERGEREKTEITFGFIPSLRFTKSLLPITKALKHCVIMTTNDDQFYYTSNMWETLAPHRMRMFINCCRLVTLMLFKSLTNIQYVKLNLMQLNMESYFSADDSTYSNLLMKLLEGWITVASLTNQKGTQKVNEELARTFLTAKQQLNSLDQLDILSLFGKT